MTRVLFAGLVVLFVAAACAEVKRTDQAGAEAQSTLSRTNAPGGVRALIPVFYHEEKSMTANNSSGDYFSIAPEAENGDGFTVVGRWVCVYDVTWKMDSSANPVVTVQRQVVVTPQVIAPGNAGWSYRHIPVNISGLPSETVKKAVRDAVDPKAAGTPISSAAMEDAAKRLAASASFRDVRCPEKFLNAAQHEKLFINLARKAGIK